jgi:hypothetical protein
LCPWSRASRRLRVGVAGTSFVLLFSAAGFAAAPRFEVSGIVTVTDEALDVRVDVRNSGDAPAAPLTVFGEMFGERRQAHFETGLRPGQATSAHLLFPLAVPRPGVHALPLLLEYPEGGPADAAGNLPLASQRAYLLLALGGTAEPAVRIDAPELRLDTRGELRVGLESLDGAPHRVSLRVLTARGIRAESPPLEVEVPAHGTVASTVVLMRSGAPRGTRHGILLVAGTLDGALERTSVATSIVEIASDPGLMPALWRPLVVLALLLLAWAAVLEFRRFRAAGRRAAPEADPAEP